VYAWGTSAATRRDFVEYREIALSEQKICSMEEADLLHFKGG
jgi:hypothetical protein